MMDLFPEIDSVDQAHDVEGDRVKLLARLQSEPAEDFHHSLKRSELGVKHSLKRVLQTSVTR